MTIGLFYYVNFVTVNILNIYFIRHPLNANLSGQNVHHYLASSTLYYMNKHGIGK